MVFATERACITQGTAHAGETCDVECTDAGLYKYYPRDRRRAGNGVAQDVKIMGSSPRPSPAAPVIVEVASGSSSNRLAPRASHGYSPIS